MTKVEKKKRASEILNQYKIGSSLEGPELDFIMEILMDHPSAQQKIGVGIKRIFIGGDAYRNRCFWIERIDGTRTDFSYLKCINGADDPYSKFSKAGRSAVLDQIKSIESKPGEHVHHSDKQFAEIVALFIKTYKVDLQKIEYIEGDGVTSKKFKDKSTADLFALFHKRMAKLESISIEQHKSIPVARYKS